MKWCKKKSNQTNGIKKKLVIKNWNTKIHNMHTSQYNFIKNKNKCDVTIKSIITKRHHKRKKKGWNNKKIGRAHV